MAEPSDIEEIEAIKATVGRYFPIYDVKVSYESLTLFISPVMETLEDDFESMIKDIKAKEILFARKKQVNIDSLKRACISISKIPESVQGKKILELDINPFILNEHEGKAVDARIVFEK